MTEMVYDYGKPGILDEGEIRGYKYIAASYGSHPCAYVQIPKGHPYHGSTCNQIDIDCHGGLVFSGRLYRYPGHFAIERDGYWIGWHYAHAGDFTAYPEITMEGHRYTTQEVLADVAQVVKQLVEAAGKEE